MFGAADAEAATIKAEVGIVGRSLRARSERPHFQVIHKSCLGCGGSRQGVYHMLPCSLTDVTNAIKTTYFPTATPKLTLV